MTIRFRRNLSRGLIAGGVALLCFSVVGCAGGAPWINTALGIVPTAVMIITQILGFAALATGGALAPAEVALITGIGNEVTSGLKALQAAIAEYQSNPQTTTQNKIDDVLKTLGDSLSSALKTFHVSNPASQAKITSMFQVVVGIVQEIEQVIPAITGKASIKQLKGLADKFGVRHGDEATLEKVAARQIQAYKDQFNNILTTPSGDAATDAALAKVTPLK